MTKKMLGYEDITAHPNYPFMQGDNVFYGIEFETAVPDQNVNFTVGTHFHPEEVPGWPNGWKSGKDVTIMAPAGYTAIEFVSPKLKGFDGIVQIVQVLDDLKERGAIVNSSTGLHIHVDGTDLDVRDIKKIKQMYVQYEKLFFAVLGEKAQERYSSQPYCSPSPDWSEHNNMPSNEKLDRYRALNLRNWHNLTSKKTVEFRLFAGELEPEKVITYLMMCVALVVYSRNCTRVHGFGTAPTDLKDLCKKFVNNVMKNKANQICPEFDLKPAKMARILNQEVPKSTVSI